MKTRLLSASPLVISASLFGCATSTTTNCDPTNRNIFTIARCSRPSSSYGYEARHRTISIELERERESNQRARSVNSDLERQLHEERRRLEVIQARIDEIERDSALISQRIEQGRSYDVNSATLRKEMVALLRSLEREASSLSQEVERSAIPEHQKQAFRQDLASYLHDTAIEISSIKTAPAQALWLIVRNFASRRIRLLGDIADGFKVLLDGYAAAVSP